MTPEKAFIRPEHFRHLTLPVSQTDPPIDCPRKSVKNRADKIKVSSSNCCDPHYGVRADRERVVSKIVFSSFQSSIPGTQTHEGFLGTCVWLCTVPLVLPWPAQEEVPKSNCLLNLFKSHGTRQLSRQTSICPGAKITLLFATLPPFQNRSHLTE